MTMRTITVDTPYGSITQDAYAVDGRLYDDPDSDMDGEGTFPPFRIFDLAAQDYLPGTFATRDEAERHMRRLP